MWARATYDFGLSSKKFYRLTPRQYHLLWERHREHLLHSELIVGINTAATINHSMAPPEKAVCAGDFMPNLDARPAPEAPITLEQRQAKDAWTGQRLLLASEMETYANTGVAGPTMIQRGLAKAPENDR